jgi:polyisoprenoid-binding protein YceI
MGGMKPPLLFLALLAGVAAGPGRAAPEVFDLDPDHSFVHFEVLHFSTSTLRGRFGPVRGTVQLDRAAHSGYVGLRIPTNTLDTGLRILDARLRQGDLLATEAHPEAFFVATQFRFQGEQLTAVHGEFTFRGISQPLTLTAQRFSCRSDAQGEVCGGDFEARLLRSDFGADFGVPFVANEVKLLVQVEGRRR